MNLIAIYFVIFEMISVVKKKRNIYDKVIEKIKQLWELNERAYVIQQLIEMLRNIRKIAFKRWIIHDAMKTLIKIIDYRLNHSKRKMRIENSLTNDDWAKVIVEKFISFQLITSTSIMIIISPSSIKKKKKKNQKIFLVVFFFSSLILSSIEAKKKNQRIILVDFFLEISSISSYFLLIDSFFSWSDSSLFDVFSFFFRFVSSESSVERASFFFINVVVYRESSLSLINLTSYFEEFDNVSFVVSTIVSFVASSSQSIAIAFDHRFLSFVALTSAVTRKWTRSIVSSVSNKKEKIVEKACVCIVSKK
jgi:hypothetical protein